MAKLKVSSELMLQCLFPDQIGLKVKNISFDSFNCVITLDITGPAVPDSEEVKAIIQVQRQTTIFEPQP